MDSQLEQHSRHFYFTIDVDYVPGSERGLIDLYDFCERLELVPTLFVSGMFASEYSELITEAAQRGYGIGTHGWAHGKEQPDENFQQASYEEQKRRVQLATEAVEKAAGFRPNAFRAPNLWVSETTLRVLEEEGYCFDSSVPARRFDWGYGRVNSLRYFRAPLWPYYPSLKHLAQEGACSVLEVAPSAYFVPLNMSGLRVLGLRLLQWAVRQVGKESPTLVFYLHPAEFVEAEHLRYVGRIPRRHLVGIGPENFRRLKAFVDYVLSRGYVSSRLEDNG